jgi:hypothetical protein
LSTDEEAQACFDSGPHTIDGSKVEVKRATPKGEKPTKEVSLKTAEPIRLSSRLMLSAFQDETLRKVFIGGLSYNTKDDGLRDYFAQVSR